MVPLPFIDIPSFETLRGLWHHQRYCFPWATFLSCIVIYGAFQVDCKDLTPCLEFDDHFKKIKGVYLVLF